jgi:hypothetical protein
MIRVALDTNIVVSVLLQPLGPPAEVFRRALNRSIQLCVSGLLYAEYEEVISRRRFRRSPEAARAMWLATGNLKHFPLTWRETKIVTARQMLYLVGTGE